jgi:hypothetical protein
MDPHAIQKYFTQFSRAKRMAAVLLFVCCLSFGYSLYICGQSAPKSGEPLLRAFVELFEDADQSTRLEAYFLSAGLPVLPELEQILRRRLDSADRVERIIASYALAAMTRDREDVDVFLDAFPEETQLFIDITDAEWELSGTFNAGMADFLLLLAYEPRTREKALPHLVRTIRNLPKELESLNRHFKDPLVIAYIDRHWDDAKLDYTGFKRAEVRHFSQTGRCGEKLVSLLQHGDTASKITARMMTRRMWIPDDLMEASRNFQFPPDSLYRYLEMDVDDEDLVFFSNLLLTEKDRLACLLDAEKKLYRPPLEGIVGRLYGQLYKDETRAPIVHILSEARQYGKDWLEVYEIHRLMLLY